jgi:N-acetyl-anhydromuramyl-L-alanine amidase AmpD
MDIGVDEIREWHTAKGWSDVGYHYVIKRDGTLEKGRADTKQGAHVKGHNKDSLGVCLVGGVNAEGKPDANFTKVQYFALDVVLSKLTLENIGARVTGHRELYSGKACPSFDAEAFWYGESQ